jgi:hypothetical protein
MTAIENTTDSVRGLQAVTGGTPANYGLGGDGSIIQSVHFIWDAAFVGSFTIWSCNIPDSGPGPVTLVSSVAGEWIQQQPPTGYTAISPAGAGTVGASPLIVNVPGGTAGGAFMDIGNLGGKRLRTQVICTTQGVIRIRPNGKD